MSEALLAKRAADIRALFGRIAPRYDALNRLLSLGQDLRWRRLVARRLRELAPERLLDVCTGTGDLALGAPRRSVAFASDFCLPMLARARRKDVGGRLRLFAADALRLPLADGSVEVATVAFGIRNFEELELGLAELARVLAPGGTLLVLEFSRPRGLLAPLLGWWVRQVPPLVGRLVSGDPEAYAYLTDSVQSFPDGRELAAVFERAGLGAVARRSLTGGVATIYEAVKTELDRPEEDR